MNAAIDACEAEVEAQATARTATPGREAMRAKAFEQMRKCAGQMRRQAAKKEGEVKVGSVVQARPRRIVRVLRE